MAKATDIHPAGAELYLLPIQTRVPLKFGAETLTSVTCARVGLRVEDAQGRSAVGWGETPLSVQWVWPSVLPFAERHGVLVDFCIRLAKAWAAFKVSGHPIEVGHAFQRTELARLRNEVNWERRHGEPMPWLAALTCCSAFDLALHDAYGMLHGIPTYETYNGRFMNADLGAYVVPGQGADLSFAGTYPCDFLLRPRRNRLPAWHLVGGKDLLDSSERDGSEPRDGHPVILGDWIRRDGLKCLKVKLCGNDARWDYARLVRVGEIALAHGCDWLSTDFNCMVTDPDYVNEILDRLLAERPRIFAMILYVEQPFPYDLEAHRIPVHSVAARKPLFMDESAHDWRLIRLGRSLGWTGVALKTCKTQTGALLSQAWAKAHGMGLMVQDLTNPMLAQVPHMLLAAYADTIQGVETNSMQFYPEASLSEESVHPGIYKRRQGMVDLFSIRGPGFGYRLNEIIRYLPEPAAAF